MDATVAGALSTALTTFAGDMADQIAVVVPLALPLLVTIAGVFITLRLFRAIAHV